MTLIIRGKTPSCAQLHRWARIETPTRERSAAALCPRCAQLHRWARIETGSGLIYCTAPASGCAQLHRWARIETSGPPDEQLSCDVAAPSFTAGRGLKRLRPGVRQSAGDRPRCAQLHRWARIETPPRTRRPIHRNAQAAPSFTAGRGLKPSRGGCALRWFRGAAPSFTAGRGLKPRRRTARIHQQRLRPASPLGED